MSLIDRTDEVMSLLEAAPFTGMSMEYIARTMGVNPGQISRYGFDTSYWAFDNPRDHPSYIKFMKSITSDKPSPSEIFERDMLKDPELKALIHGLETGNMPKENRYLHIITNPDGDHPLADRYALHTLGIIDDKIFSS